MSGSKERLAVVIDLAKTVFHFGFIPTVLYLGKIQSLLCSMSFIILSY